MSRSNSEHVYITAFRKKGQDIEALPDLYKLMPWARARLERQGEEVRARYISKTALDKVRRAAERVRPMAKKVGG